MRTSRSAMSLAGTVLTAVTLLYLLLVLDWVETYHVLIQSDPGWFLLGFVFFIINYVLRSLRFRLLYKSDKLTAYDLSGVTFVYGMFNYILPAKTGELSYILMAKSHLNINALHSTSVILAARLFDISAICLFIPLVVFLGEGALPNWVYNGLIVFDLILVTLLAALFFWLRKYARHIETVLNSKWGYIKKELLTAFNSLRRWSDFIVPLGLAVAIWLCIYTNFYCIVRGMGFEADIYQIIVISIVLVPLTLLPQGIANLGTHEIAWVSVFQMFGVKHQDALQIAFGSHVVLTLFVILLGIIGVALLRLRQTEPL